MARRNARLALFGVGTACVLAVLVVGASTTSVRADWFGFFDATGSVHYIGIAESETGASALRHMQCDRARGTLSLLLETQQLSDDGTQYRPVDIRIDVRDGGRPLRATGRHSPHPLNVLSFRADLDRDQSRRFSAALGDVRRIDIAFEVPDIEFTSGGRYRASLKLYAGGALFTYLSLSQHCGF